MISARRIAFGTLVMGAGNVLKAILQVALFPIMAHLLGPSEFGLYALAMPVITFMLMLADGGLGQSLAREPETNWEVWSSAFWLLLASAIVLGIGVVIWSFALAVLANQPRLPPMMAALSLSLVLFVVAVPSNARLLRQGRMEVGPIGDIFGTIIGGGGAIVLAMYGAGAWSLVGQTLLTFVARTAVALIAAPVVPKRHFSFSGLRPHLAIGGSIVGIKLVDAGDRTLENALYGRWFGSAALGSFGFAIQITRFICESLSNALWSALYVRSLRARDDVQIVRDYKRLLRLMAILLFPAAALIAAEATNIITILLGARWIGAVQFLQFLLPTYALAVAGALGSAVLYAKGESVIQLRINAVSAFMRIAGVAIAPWTGITALAIWLALVNIYVFARSIIAAARILQTDPMALISTLLRPTICVGVAGLSCYIFSRMAPSGIISTILSISVGLVIYLILLLLADRHALARDVTELMNLVRKSQPQPTPSVSD